MKGRKKISKADTDTNYQDASVELFIENVGYEEKIYRPLVENKDGLMGFDCFFFFNLLK